MRRIAILLAAVCALALAPAAGAAEFTVQITGTGFAPAALSIEPGDTVRWRNADTADHQVASDTGVFRSPVLKPGETFTFRFTRAGTFPYSDALKATSKGTVVVSPAPELSVTIAASRTVVVYGGAVTLSGSVSNGRAGENVRVVASAYRGGTTTTTVQTDAEGDWKLVVRPRIRTTYRAVWRGRESSTEPAVHVRPRVGIRVVNMRTATFFVRVTAAYSYQGKRVSLQRRTFDGRWVTVRRATLGPLSSAQFRATLPRSARVRVIVPTSPGYLSGVSRVVLVRR